MSLHSHSFHQLQGHHLAITYDDRFWHLSWSLGTTENQKIQKQHIWVRIRYHMYNMEVNKLYDFKCNSIRRHAG